MQSAPWTKHSVSMPQCFVICSTSGRLSSRASTTRVKPSSFSSSAPCRVWTLIWVEPWRGSWGAMSPQNRTASFRLSASKFPAPVRALKPEKPRYTASAPLNTAARSISSLPTGARISIFGIILPLFRRAHRAPIHASVFASRSAFCLACWRASCSRRASFSRRSVSFSILTLSSASFALAASAI